MLSAFLAFSFKSRTLPVGIVGSIRKEGKKCEKSCFVWARGQSHVGGHLRATIYLLPRCQKQVLPITCFKDIQNKSHQVVDNTSKVGLQSSSSVLNKAFAHVADSLLGGEVERVDDGIFFPQTLMQIEELAVPSVHIPFCIPYSDVHLSKKKAEY